MTVGLCANDLWANDLCANDHAPQLKLPAVFTTEGEYCSIRHRNALLIFT